MDEKLFSFPNPVNEVSARLVAAGVVFSVSAAVLAVGLGLTTAAYVVLGVLAFFAILESAFGLCVGCRVFAQLMHFGIISEQVCERCNKLNLAGAPARGAPVRNPA